MSFNLNTNVGAIVIILIFAAISLIIGLVIYCIHERIKRGKAAINLTSEMHHSFSTGYGYYEETTEL